MYYNKFSYLSLNFTLYSAHKTYTGRKYFFRLCLKDPYSVPPVKLYTRKEPVTMETYIDDFNTSLYIP